MSRTLLALALTWIVCHAPAHTDVRVIQAPVQAPVTADDDDDEQYSPSHVMVWL